MCNLRHNVPIFTMPFAFHVFAGVRWYVHTSVDAYVSTSLFLSLWPNFIDAGFLFSPWYSQCECPLSMQAVLLKTISKGTMAITTTTYTHSWVLDFLMVMEDRFALAPDDCTMLLVICCQACCYLHLRLPQRRSALLDKVNLMLMRTTFTPIPSLSTMFVFTCTNLDRHLLLHSISFSLHSVLVYLFSVCVTFARFAGWRLL